LTDADREMRDLFAHWCRDAGLAVTVDRIGNMFARRAGIDDALPPVLIGTISIPRSRAVVTTASSACSRHWRSSAR